MKLRDRSLHPGAWWLWALGLAAAASRTLNPLLLGLVIAVAAYVVATCRTDAPWARSFAAFVRLGIVVMVLRIVFQVIFGGPSQGTVVITLPQVDLPDWAAGVSLGGAVTWPELLAAAYDGLRLATMLICVGAANALANPSRLLKSVPGALYEVGVAVVVALTFAPQLVMHLCRVRQARRLRGRPDRGFRGVRGAAMPVLEGALERSLDLAAAMDSRGYGRRADQPHAMRLTTATLTLVGLLGVCIGVYGLLDAASPGVLGLPLLGLGALLAALGIALGGRRSIRTRYRPDPWRLPEWAVSLSGAAAATTMTIAAISGAELDPTVVDGWPTLPLLPVVGLLVALLPAYAASPAALTGPAPQAGGSHSDRRDEIRPPADREGRRRASVDVEAGR